MAGSIERPIVFRRSGARWCNKPLALVGGESIPAELAVLRREAGADEKGAWITSCAPRPVVDLLRDGTGAFTAAQTEIPALAYETIRHHLETAGVKKGIPDLVIWSENGRVRFTEVKWVGHDSLSAEQHAFLSAAGESGAVAWWKFSEWDWVDAPVDESATFLELAYRQSPDSLDESLQPIARIGRPKDRLFPVQWLVPVVASNEAAIEHVRRELDFYLAEKDEPDPWNYAIYHCGTAANLYSPVHWSYFPAPGSERA